MRFRTGFRVLDDGSSRDDVISATERNLASNVLALLAVAQTTDTAGRWKTKETEHDEHKVDFAAPGTLQYKLAMLILLFFPLQEARLRTLTHLQTPVRGSSCPSTRSSEGFSFSEKDVCAVLLAD